MKNVKLNDHKWLEEQYINKQKSPKEIAKIVNCNVDLVYTALKTAKIIRRLKYEQLHNKIWLKTKYIDDGLSTLEIAELVGAKSAHSVAQALTRANIEIRNKSDGQTFNRDTDYFVLDVPTIEGSLLGDGSLDVYNRESEISYPRFHKKNIFYDHIFYVANKIFSQNPESRISHYEKIDDGKLEQHFYVSSLSYKDLLPFYIKWYPKENEYEKVIPEDIQVSAEHLLNMFMDDGSSYRRRPLSKVKQITIVFCSECFTRDNQEMFCEKVNSIFSLGLKTTPVNSGYGWRIRVPQSKAKLFYEIIGSCPVSSMQYKWK